MIWFALLLPILTIALILWKFSHKMLWWEYAVIFVVPMFGILVSKSLIEVSQTSDIEFWGGYVKTTEYYEDWNERVSCRHPIYRTRTDSKGNTHTEFVGYQHFYDVDYHPPYWVINTTIGEFSVPQQRYKTLTTQFGNENFIDLHRSYHTNNGDKYVSKWNGEPSKVEPVTDSRHYSNRIQASSSVFNFKEVNPKDFGLYEYPKVNSDYYQRSILGSGGATHIQAEKHLDYLNATLGGTKQVRLFVLVFKDQPLEAAIEQEAYWKGGNKNEFITCIGVDTSYNIKWSYVFSWAECEDLKIEARNFIQDQKVLDLVPYAEWLGTQINTRFIRKNFNDFDYISIDPPLWGIVTVYLLTIGVCIGIGVWSVKNDFTE